MNRPPLVLLVDDSEDDRSFFKRALQKLAPGLTLVEIVDGREAIDYLGGHGAFSDRDEHPSPTHVILDLKMPKCSGVQVLEWIRKEAVAPNLPVIVLTSSDAPEDRRQVGALGVDDYLVKPASFENLLAVVRSILRRWNLVGSASVP